MIQVIAADDHPLLQEGIKKVLEGEIDIRLGKLVGSGSELLSALAKESYDVLILDMDMPGRSGLELLKDISDRHPFLPVLILTIHPADRFAIRTLKAGAAGYLCKSNITNELAKAIRTVTQRDKRYITAEVAQLLAQQVKQGEKQNHDTLSDREYEVLCLLAAGKNVKQIASELSLSSHTIHTYRSRIKKKMDLSTDVEMTRYALEHGLVS